MSQSKPLNASPQLEGQKRGRGRPRKPNALSGAERARRCREKKKLLGLTKTRQELKSGRDQDVLQIQKDLANLHYFVTELLAARQSRKRLDPVWLSAVILEHVRIGSRYQYL